MHRLESELTEEAVETPALPPALVAVLDRYEPTGIPEADREAVRAFVTQVLTDSQLTGPESARKMLTHLGHLVAHALEQGHALAIDELLTSAHIDDYIRHGMPGSSTELKAQRRTRLLNLARAVNPGPTVPPKLEPIPHAAIKPCYAPAELRLIIRAAGEQSTPERRRDVSTLVGMGAGAGADSTDIRHLLVRHVEDHGEHEMLVRFQEPRPRIVPVRRLLVPTLRAGVTGRDPDSLLLGRQADRGNLAARVLSEVSIYRGPDVEMNRLRATWLADLMTDPIPVAIILQAAGLKSARTLTDLLPHLDPWMAAKGLATGEDHDPAGA